eukprot:1156119-Pelagomonas_calceolata.AAC.18
MLPAQCQLTANVSAMLHLAQRKKQKLSKNMCQAAALSHLAQAWRGIQPPSGTRLSGVGLKEGATVLKDTHAHLGIGKQKQRCAQ